MFLIVQRATSLSLSTFMHWRRKWQPTPVFLPGESQGWGSLMGCRLWSRTESDMTEATWQQQGLEGLPLTCALWFECGNHRHPRSQKLHCRSYFRPSFCRRPSILPASTPGAGTRVWNSSVLRPRGQPR